MKCLYFSFFHSYVPYGNWCSTSMTKFKNIFSKEKQAIKTIPMTSLDYKKLKSEEIMDKLGILNIFKLNIYQTVNLMFRVKNNIIPEAFRTKFQIVQHNYATRHSENNFEERKITFKVTKFAISSRGPLLWNKHTDRFLRTITSALLFKAKIKEYLVKLRNVTMFNKAIYLFSLNFVKTCINLLMPNGAEWMHFLKQIGSKCCPICLSQCVRFVSLVIKGL